MQRKKLLVWTIPLTLLLLLYLFKPQPYAESPGEPIYFTTSNGTLLDLIAPTVLLEGSHSKAENIGISIYNFIPLSILKKITPPRVSKDQLIPREKALLIAKNLFPVSQSVNMVHPANVTGESSTLAWGLASVIAGDPTISLNDVVAATGTLLPGGQVGAVGAVATKAQSPQVAKSLLTLTPTGQVDEALDTFQLIKSNSIPIGVSNILEAVGVLCVISLSNSPTCDNYLTLSSSNYLQSTFHAVRLPSTNTALCALLRNSKSDEFKNIGCKKVHANGLWYIELSNLNSI